MIREKSKRNGGKGINSGSGNNFSTIANWNAPVSNVAASTDASTLIVNEELALELQGKAGNNDAQDQIQERPKSADQMQINSSR